MRTMESGEVPKSIKVRTPDEKVYSVAVNSELDLAKFQATLETLSGVKVAQQRLFFNGKALKSSDEFEPRDLDSFSVPPFRLIRECSVDLTPAIRNVKLMRIRTYYLRIIRLLSRRNRVRRNP